MVDSGVVDSGTDVSGGVVVVRADVVNVGICSSVDGVVVLSLSVSAGLPPGSSTPPVGSVDGGLVDTVSRPSVSTGRSVVVVDRAVVVIGTTPPEVVDVALGRVVVVTPPPVVVDDACSTVVLGEVLSSSPLRVTSTTTAAAIAPRHTSTAMRRIQ